MPASASADGLRGEMAGLHSDLLAFEQRFTRRFLAMLAAHDETVLAAMVLR